LKTVPIKKYQSEYFKRNNCELYYICYLKNIGRRKNMKKQAFSQTKQLAYTALGIALVFTCTSFLNLRLPIAANGGLIHLGNVSGLFVKRTGV